MKLNGQTQILSSSIPVDKLIAPLDSSVLLKGDKSWGKLNFNSLQNLPSIPPGVTDVITQYSANDSSDFASTNTTFSLKTSPVANRLRGVCYAFEQYVLVGNFGTIVFSNDEGDTWTKFDWSAFGYPTGLTSSNSIIGVTYGKGYLVICTDNGKVYYRTSKLKNYDSANGVTVSGWTESVLPNTNLTLECLTFANNKFLLGTDISTSVGGVFSSSDLINWDLANTEINIYGITYGKGKYIAVGGLNNTDNNSLNNILYSYDGINWNYPTKNTTAISDTGHDLRSCSYGGGYFFACGALGIYAKSSDGINWLYNYISDSSNYTSTTAGTSTGCGYLRNSIYVNNQFYICSYENSSNSNTGEIYSFNPKTNTFTVIDTTSSKRHWYIYNYENIILVVGETGLIKKLNLDITWYDNTIPTVSSNKKLWARSKLFLSDGSIVYSDNVLIQPYLDQIDVPDSAIYLTLSSDLQLLKNSKKYQVITTEINNNVSINLPNDAEIGKSFVIMFNNAAPTNFKLNIKYYDSTNTLVNLTSLTDSCTVEVFCTSINTNSVWATTYQDSIGIGKNTYYNSRGIGIGNGAYLNAGGIGIGSGASNNSEGIGIGSGAYGNNSGGIGIGNNSNNNWEDGIGIGNNSTTNKYGWGTIALGPDSSCRNQNEISSPSKIDSVRFSEFLIQKWGFNQLQSSTNFQLLEPYTAQFVKIPTSSIVKFRIQIVLVRQDGSGNGSDLGFSEELNGSVICGSNGVPRPLHGTYTSNANTFMATNTTSGTDYYCTNPSTYGGIPFVVPYSVEKYANTLGSEYPLIRNIEGDTVFGNQTSNLIDFKMDFTENKFNLYVRTPAYPILIAANGIFTCMGWGSNYNSL